MQMISRIWATRRPVCRRGAAFLAAGLASATFARNGAEAGESRWAGPDVAQVRLVSAGAATDGEAFWGGLDFRLKPGWKIYWRSPGMAGRPPRADWSSSRGLVAGGFLWPRPRLFRFAGIETVGYKGAVLLPVRLTPAGLAPSGGARARILGVDLDYQTCREICIPVRVRLRLAAAALNRPDADAARRIAAARAAQPVALARPRIRRVPGGRVRIAVPRGPAGGWRAPRLVVEAGPRSLVNLPPTSLAGGWAVFEFVAPAGRRRLGLLIVDGPWAGAGAVDRP